MEGEEHLETSRIKELFKQDAFLKIISVFIAIILWSYVSLVLDPEIEKEFPNIPVKFINEQELINSGMTLINSEYSVNFVVKGRRNIINSINKEKIFASADLSGLSKLGRNEIEVKIEGYRLWFK
jgi:YbbR domain-containing protein